MPAGTQYSPDGQAALALSKLAPSKRMHRIRSSLSSFTFRISKSTKSKSVRCDKNLLDHLLALPVELRILVLNNLDIQDLLYLRLSSRACHQLVDDSAPALVRHYARSLTSLHRQLYPPPPPDGATFRYLIDNEHRLRTSRHLASVIADFFETEILGLRSSRAKRVFRKIRVQMIESLLPLFFTLGHFFELYRCMILERAMAQWRPGQAFQIATGGPTLWDDQVSILNRYDHILMLNCYHAYGYLLQVLECQLRPGRLASMMRKVQRLNANPARTREVEVLLMLGGMEQVGHVLQGKSFGARRNALDTFIKHLKPTTNSNWRIMWQNLGVENEIIKLDKVPNLRLRLPALHLVWVPSALKLLLCNKIIDRVDFNTETAAVSTPGDFVYDLLGLDYDQLWVPNDLDDDDADDAAGSAIPVRNDSVQHSLVSDGDAEVSDAGQTVENCVVRVA
ncbi:hypothetical protein BT63DRAFT_476758 [Microthyrium microscopicum]|uniref:F-box domain-containing protein n=1 Tax=Microthyrium microscopicum TaxID=703497 RepID=A0A6A6UKC7_9PEZI|nr:hypothetical protein BT63DRAFT_476758 [Microthyrium microscopicum]